jgi:hypothetical protein
MSGQQNIEQTKTLVWLDDIRDPSKSGWLKYIEFYIDNDIDNIGIYWVKNLNQLKIHLEVHGLPDIFSFDTIVDSYQIDMFDRIKNDIEEKEKLGYKAVVKVIDYCIKNDLDFPKYHIHSGTKEERNEIINYINNFQNIKLELT